MNVIYIYIDLMTCCLFLSGTDSLFKQGGRIADLLPAY